MPAYMIFYPRATLDRTELEAYWTKSRYDFRRGPHQGALGLWSPRDA